MALNAENQQPEVSPNGSIGERQSGENPLFGARDYQILLDISAALARVRKRDELFNFIHDRLQPVFGFNQYFNIAVYNIADRTLQMLFTKTNEQEQNESRIPVFMQPFAAEGIFETIINSSKIIIHTEDWKTSPKQAAIDEAAAQIWRDLDFKSALSVALRSFGKVIGTFHVHFFEPRNFTETELKLFKAIAEQIAVAVSNILANEKILEREREKSQLLEITKSIASVQDVDSLFRTVYDQLQPIFAFDCAVIKVLLPDGKSFRHLNTTLPEIIKTQQNVEAYLFASNISGTPNELTLGSDKPKTAIFDAEELAARYEAELPDKTGNEIVKLLNFKEWFFTPLYNRGKLIGSLEFFAAEHNHFSETQFTLLENAAQQIAVTVANILANEEILEREKEKGLLLSLSEDMATIRNSDDLWRVMTGKFKQLLPSDESPQVFVLNPDGKTLRTLLINPSKEAQKTAEFQQHIFETLQIENTPFEETLKSAAPRSFDGAYFQEKYPEYWGTKIWAKVGIRQMMSCRLVYGNQVIGIFNVLTRRENAYSELQFSLFKAIADQVAVAVANILANEEILEREKEKTLLLSLSEDMATIRDREDLWRVMMDKVKKIAPFDDAVLLTLDKDLTHYDFVLTMSPEERRTHPLYAEVVGDNPVAGNPVEWYLAQPADFVIQDLHLLKADSSYPSDHPAVKMMLETGLTFSLVYKMRWADSVIGLLIFHFQNKGRVEESKYNLYKSVADQVTVAVANILANEEILEREREKSVLLSISEDISKIRDKDDLFRVITDKLKPIFGFDDAVVFVADCERDSYYLLLANTPPNRLQSEFHRPLTTATLPLKNSIEEWIVSHDKPFIYSIERFAERFPDAPGIRLAQEVGIKDSIIGVLKSGGKIIGSFHIHSERENFFQPQQLSIFQSVTEQLAVAVANILANEEILVREREKSQLLAISEQLATIRDKHDLFKIVFEKLKPVFQFDDAVITLFDDKLEKSRHLHTSASDEQRNNPYYRTLMNGEKTIKNSPYEEVLGFNAPQIVNLEKWFEEYSNDLGIKVALDFGLTESAFLPLHYGGRLLGALEFHSLEKNRFSESQMSLYRNLADQMAVAVSNILVNEEILEREREKSVLLTISEDISAIRSIDSLFEIIYHKIQPLFGSDFVAITVVDEERNRGRHLLAEGDWLWKQMLSNNKMIGANTNFEYRGHFVEYVHSLPDGTIYSIPDFAGRFQGDVITFCEQMNLVETFLAKLYNGGKLLGDISFHSRKRGRFANINVALLRNVANQIAVAVANILANEEILERERKQAVLYRIAKHIAQVKDESDLLRLIVEELKPIYQFYDIGLPVLDEARNYYVDWSALLPDISPSEANYHLSAEQAIELSADDPLYVYMMERLHEANAPVIVDFAQLARLGITNQTLEIEAQYGYREALVALLKVGGKVFGWLNLNSLSNGHFQQFDKEMFQAITDQIAVAVANILANKEVAQLAEERRLRAEQLSKANEALARTSERLTAQTDLSAFLGQVVIEAVTQMDAADGHLLTLDEERNVLQTVVLVQDRKMIPSTPLADEMPVEEAGFWSVLNEILQPRRFDIENEADLFWRGSIEYLKQRGMHSVIVFPLLAGQKVLGTMGLAFNESNPVSERQTELINALAHQAALAIQLTKLAEEAKQAAMLAERNRIAREIHDTLAQSFTGIILQLEAGTRILNDEPRETEAHLDRASNLAREGLREARRSVQALRPLELEQTDLATTIEQFLDRMTGGTKVNYEFSLVGKPVVFAPEVEANFLRIGQEAVTNALRHAGARRIKIELSYAPNAINLVIADDGAGYDAETTREGFGLIGIRERARSIGAELKTASRLREGTKIKVSYRKGEPRSL